MRTHLRTYMRTGHRDADARHVGGRLLCVRDRLRAPGRVATCMHTYIRTYVHTCIRRGVTLHPSIHAYIHTCREWLQRERPVDLIINSTQLNSTQLSSTQLDSTQLNSTQLNSTQLNSTLISPGRVATEGEAGRLDHQLVHPDGRGHAGL